MIRIYNLFKCKIYLMLITVMLDVYFVKALLELYSEIDIFIAKISMTWFATKFLIIFFK